MSKNKFIYGFQKNLIDLKLLIRLYFKAFFHFGVFKSFAEIKKYNQDKRNLFRTKLNRYLKSENGIIAAPDMPPINSQQFINFIIKDMEWINGKKAPMLVFVIICITSRCPYKCPYCYNSNLHSKTERLNIETITRTIQELINYGISSIYLSGGEPIMRWDDLILILNLYGNSKTRFWLLSTGWNLDKDKLSMLKKRGLTGVMISLDSFDPERINSIKGTPTAYGSAIKTIKIANEVGLIVAIDSVFGKTLLQKSNFNKFVRLAGEHGAHFINCYSPRQMHQILENEYGVFNLQDFEKLEKLITENHKSTKFYDLPISYSPDLWEAKRGCVGGKLFIYIDPEGNVKPCPFIDKSLGNIKEKEINEILHKIQNNYHDHICATNKMLSKNN